MEGSGVYGIPWLASNAYAYPALEVLHIVGITLLVGNLVLLELRVWGWASALPMQALGRYTLIIACSGFGLIALSGFLMFAADPVGILTNRAFQLKIGLIMLAGLNAFAFHLRGGLDRVDAVARLQTALSLGLWLTVIICGRWIAYQ
jgi:hypothetical protein